MSELTYEQTCKHVWDTLSAIDCSEHTEQKNGLTYLSWAWAYGIIMEHFPTFNYVFRETEVFPDTTMQVHCVVSITHDGNVIERGMWLPVMDYRNKAIPNPDAMAINTAKMRCMTKAISMLGLGAYIYAGEDLPAQAEKEKAPAPKPDKSPKKKAKKPELEEGMSGAVIEDEEGAEFVAEAMIELATGMHADSMKSLIQFWNANKRVINVLDQDYPDQYKKVKQAFTLLKTNLQEDK